jgi:hypothetical protein
MKIGFKGISVLIIFVLLSCSKNDRVETVNVIEPDIDVILIGEDLDRVFQYEYNSLKDTAVISDLTQELDLRPSYLTLRQEGNLLSFYTFTSGNFSLIQKNVETGASTLEANFYTENDERSILWGTNDGNNIYLGYFETLGTSNFGVLTIDINSGAQKQLIIEDAIQTSYQPIYHQGKLLLTYRDNADNYKVAIVDTATNTILTRLEFGTLVPNIFINEVGDVVILKSNRGEDYSYAIYNANSFETTGEVDFSLTRYFDPGILMARLIEQKLFYYSLYIQPAAVRFGPATFDLNTNVETLVDMERIVNEVENQNGKRMRLISQGIDEQSGVYLVGYANLNDSNTYDGGMLIVSFEGDLIKNIALSFVPTYFLLKNR